MLLLAWMEMSFRDKSGGLYCGGQEVKRLFYSMLYSQELCHTTCVYLIQGGRTSFSIIIGSLLRLMTLPAQVAAIEKQNHTSVKRSVAFIEVMWLPPGSREWMRHLSFPPSKSIQKYSNKVNQLISPPLTDPLPWPRTGLSEIRKTTRIDLMGYYWVHNEACQQQWQVLNILNESCVW